VIEYGRRVFERSHYGFAGGKRSAEEWADLFDKAVREQAAKRGGSDQAATNKRPSKK